MQVKKDFPATAITLKSFDLGESDKILSLFSKEHGIIRAVAKGIKKNNNKFGGRLELLNINHLLIRHGRNLGTIIQCDTFMTFPLLRLDYDKLIYSLFLGELVLIFSNEDEPAENIFDLLVFTLGNMQHYENPLCLTIWFEMHFLTILGYQSNLNNCDICQEEINIVSNKIGFSLNTGSLICEKCLKLSRNYKMISNEIVNILKTLKTYDLNEIREFSPSVNELSRIQNILKEYFSNLSERKIKTLSILETSQSFS